MWYWACVYDCTIHCGIYRINYTCPEDCRGRGNCSEEGRCECVEGWTGESCEVPTCPNDCFNNGQCTSNGCQCPQDFTGQFAFLHILASVHLHNMWETIRPHITHHRSVTSDLCRCGLFYPCVPPSLEICGLYHHW